MKKEHVEHLCSSFKDFKGVEHKMVLVAISRELPTNYGELYSKEKDIDEETAVSPVENWVVSYTDWNEESVTKVSKCLHLGVSICHAEDTYNERTGIAKATHRARNSDPVLFVAKNGYINSKMVRAFLEQEAEYIQNNPGCVIEGYDAQRDKYVASETLKQEYENLSVEDKNLVNILAEIDVNKMKELQKFVKARNEISK